MKIKGNLVDLYINNIYRAEIEINENRIQSIKEINEPCDFFILPGFIDSHVHIESSMLSPVEFSKQALKHGTIAVVADPHEIANVCGLDGVDFMINNSKNTPLKIFFGAPSCVPASNFETSGSVIGINEINNLLQKNEVYMLSEMMNFPGVIFNNPLVLGKINAAKTFGKPIDGHAPGLTGINLKKYIEAGISTDHECTTIYEAREKILNGMKILIREGSAAKNFEALFPLIDSSPEHVMFCSDDIHPNDLIFGHINELIKHAVTKGSNLFNILRAVSHNPVKHYNLPVGLLKINDYADFIVVNNLINFDLERLFINGKEVFNKKSGFKPKAFKNENIVINNFHAEQIKDKDICIKIKTGNVLNAIEVIDGELITNTLKIQINKNKLEELVNNNELNKIVLINRYCSNSRPTVGYIKGFNLSGSMASTVAHDSHNIIAVGNSDADIVKAINIVISSKGGLAFINNKREIHLPLEIGGIMTNANAMKVATKYKQLEKTVKLSGCRLEAPFMTLSFMALLVIPALKISDKGLFDITQLKYVHLFE